MEDAQAVVDDLKRRLEEMGVLHLGGALKGSAKTAASKGNQSFIIKRRAAVGFYTCSDVAVVTA